MAGVRVTFRRLSGKGPNRLERAAASLVNEVRDAMNQQILTAVDIMQSEPPVRFPRNGGRPYIRTHTYANSWQPIFARASGGRLEGGIRGSAVDPWGTDYTVAVGGDAHGEGQLGIHEETGWPLAVDALEGRSSGVVLTRAPIPFGDRIRVAVRRVLRGDE